MENRKIFLCTYREGEGVQAKSSLLNLASDGTVLSYIECFFFFFFLIFLHSGHTGDTAHCSSRITNTCMELRELILAVMVWIHVG